MKAFLVMTCALLVGFCLLGVEAMNVTENTQPQTGTQGEARQLWEQAIVAKGGRERLYAVRNMLVSSQGHNYRDVSLYVFPNKLWSWLDQPEPFGRTMTMLNLKRNIGYEAQLDDAESPRRMDEQWRNSTAFLLRKAQLLYLLETQWLKPTPVSMTRGQVGRRPVDIVQTLVDGKRVDFYLDRETHLPLKVAYVTQSSGEEYWYIVFSDYTEINGIQMPQRENAMDAGNLSVSFQFNVEYNESIFECPPTIAAGAEAWRAARR